MLIDLKIDKLTHQDLGQMLMYVHYYDRYEKLPEENPTIGILLCKEKDDILVEITLPDEANIYASEYKLYYNARNIGNDLSAENADKSLPIRTEQ